MVDRRTIFLSCAQDIAELLFETSRRTEGGHFVWLEERTRGTFEFSGADLYAGWLGISLLFGRVGAECESPLWRSRARLLFDTAVNGPTEPGSLHLDGLGLLAGYGGLELVSRAIGLAESTSPYEPCTEDVTNDQPPFDMGDLITGRLSDLFATFVLHGSNTRDRPVASFLLDAATQLSPERPGLAHGGSGYVLAALASSSSWDGSLTRRATEILADESESAAGSPYAWCNGVGGICYPWAILAAASGDARVREDCIDRASGLIDKLDEFMGQPSTDWSLCHGLLGGILVLDTVASILDCNFLRSSLEKVLVQLTDVVATEDAYTLGYTGVENKTLFTGIAGIALALCHLADEARPASPVLALPLGPFPSSPAFWVSRSVRCRPRYR